MIALIGFSPYTNKVGLNTRNLCDQICLDTTTTMMKFRASDKKLTTLHT